MKTLVIQYVNPNLNKNIILAPTNTLTPTPTPKFIQVNPGIFKLVGTATPTLTPTPTPTVTPTATPTSTVTPTLATESAATASQSPTPTTTVTPTPTPKTPTLIAGMTATNALLSGAVIILAVLLILPKMVPGLKNWLHKKTE